MKRLSPASLFAAALLAMLCALQLLAILRTAPAWLPSELAIALQPGESLVLGRQELSAPRAAPRQLLLQRDASGAWLLRNSEPAQPVVLRQGEARLRSSELALQAGQVLRLGAASFTVREAADGRVTLDDGAHRWTYDGAAVLRDGGMQDACPDTALSARLVAGWNRLAPQSLSLARPLVIGGHLMCGNRIAAAAIEPGQAALLRLDDGRIALSARGAQPVLVGANGVWQDVARRDLSLAGADGFALGRTAFAIETAGDTLRLRPSGQVALSPAPDTNAPAALTRTWRERAMWTLPSPSPLAWGVALAVLLAGGLAALPLIRRAGRGADRMAARTGLARVAAAAHLAAAAMLVLVSQRSIGAPGAGISLLLAWGALWLALCWQRRASLLPLAAVLLLGAGLLVQLEMGLGASDSGWLRHFQNSAALLALALPGALLLLAGVARGAVSRPVTERVLLVLAAIALCGLLLQVCFGGETGVFDIQPFEFAKFALAALSAHCLALAAGGAAHERRDWRFWLRMAAPVLLFVFLLAAALVRVDDYSPLVLLLVWSGAMLLAWCATGGRRAALLSLACAVCLLAAGSAVIRSGGEVLGSLGFYPERFQVWSDPTVHPHTGQQMLLGARAISQGGWLGADGLLGIAALGGAAGEALAIPAIQDDFAPSFLLHRHGLLGGLALWTLQALFLVALLRVATASWRQAAGVSDFRRAWLGRFQCFLLAGGAAFVAGHLLLSWGTNLAMFPIMGQPMSFLSSGGSHLVFFICPLLAFGMASAQTHEENPSCRSMSNTKS
ncbi:FtsW/RodA/SpoVE family cell cycle protein [Massilia sp. YIM B02443]|uniref:FtsW/RodA/SpoVE family cell cycle protein n=1 Tax=Massilia sp. YIM B02443 TaxID=3050127 RepID=UPI0025B71D3C|nr:FtsW/RodA/SpoVE family cell cycle protein [Massilia sp. YIM B02443]MDN4040026.1 FtsW/RodA/SpoVE family cell cycle protein [Massilia sp. YIM B02443]